jgi:hypothetical protein
VDDVGVAVGKQTSVAPLGTDARLLVATEGGAGRQLLVRVDEDGARFQAARNLRRLLDVRAPHAGTETGVAGVGTGKDLLEVRPGLHGDNGAEGLLLDDARVVGRVVDDGGLDEEALGIGNVGLASGELVALGLAVGEEALDAVVLHLVLDGAEEVVAVVGVADLDGLCEVGHLLDELLVDGLVDIDALGGNADLAGVLESAHGDLGSDLLDVDVGENDGGVVAAELEGNALEGLGGGLHDLLTGSGGTSEGDLGNVGVGAQLSTELVVAANNLDDTRGEDLLGKLGELERCVGGEGRGLDDDAVSGQDGGSDLADGQNQGEVPGADSWYIVSSRA